MASFVTGADGKIMATSAPVASRGFTQNITGSPIDAAAAKTMASQAQQAEATKALGAGQKGSSRRRRHRGGSQSIPKVPEGGTIPGVSFAGNHVKAIDNLNQLRADKVYDGLLNAPAAKVGGFTKKRRGKSKNGRRNNRTRRGKRNKHSTRIRRSRHVL
jgi:hypothetical protein